MSESSGLPQAGWYPDPADPNARRYWDGAQWTEHTDAGAAGAWGAPPAAAGPAQPTQAWGQPAPPAYPAMAPAYGAYVPQSAPLTASGMRRVAELFSDAGRILRRAWWPIVAVSLLLWAVWGVIVAILTMLVVDVGQLTRAIELSTSSLTQYENRSLPNAVRNQLVDAWEAVPRTSSWVVWVLVGVVMILLMMVVASIQTVAVNRLAMDASAGQPVRIRHGFSSGLSGGMRLFGYMLLFGLIGLVVAALWVGLIVLCASFAPVLSVLIAIFGWFALMIVGLWLTGRLVPISVQVVQGPGALRWTWHATRTKFWAVLGRYLLWAVVASVIGQILINIVALPFSLMASASFSSGSSGPVVIGYSLLYLVIMVLSMAVSALTYIGVVPIWRDLTDDPVYRSIGPDGLPLPKPA